MHWHSRISTQIIHIFAFHLQSNKFQYDSPTNLYEKNNQNSNGKQAYRNELDIFYIHRIILMSEKAILCMQNSWTTISRRRVICIIKDYQSPISHLNLKIYTFYPYKKNIKIKHLERDRKKEVNMDIAVVGLRSLWYYGKQTLAQRTNWIFWILINIIRIGIHFNLMVLQQSALDTFGIRICLMAMAMASLCFVQFRKTIRPVRFGSFLLF